jgi:hypothetical protein
MHTASSWRKASIALALSVGVGTASAQSGIASPPDKTSGTSGVAAADKPTVAGPSTISVAPKKTQKALRRAKAASAAASK